MISVIGPVTFVPEVHIHGNLLVGVWLGVVLGVESEQCVVAGTQNDQSVRVEQIGETVLEYVK